MNDQQDEAAELFRSLVESTPDAVVLLDGEDTLRYVSPAVRSLLDLEPEELVGESLFSLVHPDDLTELRAMLAGKREAPGPPWRVGIRGRHRDGSWRSLEVTGLCPSPSAKAPATRVLCLCDAIDIDERRTNEERLVLQSKALEATSNAIVITDTEGVIQWVNPAFSRLTGYSDEEAVGQHTRILKSGRVDPEVYAALWRTIADGEVWHGELINRRKDGSLYNEEMTVTPVPGADGHIDFYIAVKQDVTERLQMEEQLRQAQKMEAVGRLAGGVAHDFNNLLQAMLGLTELLQRPDVNEAGVKLRELEGHIQRASQLTRQLVLFSRPENSKVELLDLNRVVRETVLLLFRLIRENVDLVFEPAPEPLALEADQSQVEQIVMNLAVNAADAMPDGGQLIIRTGRGLEDTVWLEVRDTGLGIPDEVREHLFEPFFTTKEWTRGTGLGLSVVHGIVTRHGGEIEVESELDGGSTFRVTLPEGDFSELLTPDLDRELVTLVGSGERILVVEDDPAVRESLKEILTGLGYRTTAVGTAQDAVRQSGEPPFDLLLSDFGLPSSSGTEVAATLQRRWPHLAVIIMSGYAEDDVISRHVMNGDLHFLQKPFTLQTLGKALRNVLSQGR